MGDSADPDLIEVLRTIVERDTGGTITPHFSGGGSFKAGLLGLASGENGELLVEEGEIRRLDELGYLDMDPVPPGKKLANFRVTNAGRSLVADLDARETATISNTNVDLSWESVEQLLRHIHSMWIDEGAPVLGVDGSTILAEFPTIDSVDLMAILLREFDRQGWIECRDSLGPQLPWGVRPSDRGITLINGWPSGDPTIASQQLLAGIEKKIEAIPDEEERSKALMAFRQIGGVVKDVGVEVIAATITRQAGL